MPTDDIEYEQLNEADLRMLGRGTYDTHAIGRIKATISVLQDLYKKSSEQAMCLELELHRKEEAAHARGFAAGEAAMQERAAGVCDESECRNRETAATLRKFGQADKSDHARAAVSALKNAARAIRALPKTVGEK